MLWREQDRSTHLYQTMIQELTIRSTIHLTSYEDVQVTKLPHDTRGPASMETHVACLCASGTKSLETMSRDFPNK